MNSMARMWRRRCYALPIMLGRSFLGVLGFSAIGLVSSGCIIDRSNDYDTAYPVIDDVNFPPSAFFTSDGTYTLNGYISFHGPSSINQLRIGQSYGGDSVWPFVATTSAIDAPVTIKFSSLTPRGSQPVTLSVIDVTGRESQGVTIYVTLN